MRRPRVLHLYRPRLPSPRAQSIQVLHTCHALAEAGCEVTLLADAPSPGAPRAQLPTAAEVLEWYGLAPTSGLRLGLPPSDHPSLQGAWFRAQVLRWCAQADLKSSYILARSKKHLREVLRLPRRARVILEAHELDSHLLDEAGRDPRAAVALERAVLAGADALVTNCEGTLRAWEARWPEALPPLRRVVYNATSPQRAAASWRPDRAAPTLGYLGSLGARKDVATLLAAAARLPGGLRLELLGGAEADLDAHRPLPSSVRHLRPLPYKEVPQRVAGWSAAVVALRDDAFGRMFCNPLKIWDYRAMGLPLVLPDLPTMRELAGPEDASWYRSGDPASMAEAMGRALEREPPAPALRSWGQRAQELLEVFEALS